MDPINVQFNVKTNVWLQATLFRVVLHLRNLLVINCFICCILYNLLRNDCGSIHHLLLMRFNNNSLIIKKDF